jgi:hypothetical protein
VTSNPDARLTFEPPRGCQLCHHDASRTANCAGCHADTEQAPTLPATLRVAVAGRPPRDRTVEFRHADHRAQTCVACHTAPVTLAVEQPGACRDCHAPHHEAASTCTACHAPAQPRAAHAGLADVHVACDACHAPAVVALLTPDRAFCATCHAGQDTHYAPRPCTTCHFLSSPEQFRAHLRKDGAAG